MPNVVVKPLVGCPVHERATFRPIKIRPMPIAPVPSGRDLNISVIPHRMKNAPQAMRSEIEI